MTDLARLESELIGRYPERWVHHYLTSFPAAYFAAFDSTDVGRHLGLMLGLTADRPVAVQAWPAGGEDWWLHVVGFDTFQFLATACTLLAVRGMSIVEGRVFTSQPPPHPPPLTRLGGGAAGRDGHGGR